MNPRAGLFSGKIYQNTVQAQPKHKEAFMESIANHVWIVDTTLRDGEQAPGVSFDLPAKIAIATCLDKAGVDEIEVGIPAMGKAIRDEIRAIVNLRLNSLITGWCRALETDLELAARCQTEGVHISFPVSPILMDAMNKTESWVMSALEHMIPKALSMFKMVSVGAQDVFRVRKEFLMDFYRTTAETGAHRIRLADTVGLATPLQTVDMIKELLSQPVKAILEFHAHNDLGMATANAVSAVEAGCQAVSVTINGLGERAGNAALEQVVMALKTLTHKSTGVDVTALYDLCRFVSKLTDMPIPPDRPITGDVVFTHESGVHCAGILKNPETYQPFLPETLGREKEKLVVGRHSGSKALTHMLAGAGITISGEETNKLLTAVRNEALKKGKYLSLEEVLKLYKDTETALS